MPPYYFRRLYCRHLGILQWSDFKLILSDAELDIIIDAVYKTQ